MYPEHVINVFTIGFGLYLQSVDQLHRDWHWQLQQTLILCRVHFFRSIERAAGPATISWDVQSRMHALLTCQSMEEYTFLCDNLIRKLFTMYL